LSWLVGPRISGFRRRSGGSGRMLLAPHFDRLCSLQTPNRSSRRRDARLGYRQRWGENPVQYWCPQSSLVLRALQEARSHSDQGLIFDAESLKVGEYLDRWLSDSDRDTVRQRTYERYESIVRVHIKPAFGRLKLKALTPNHVRSLYRRKLDSGLAPRTVRYIRTTLHKALSQAVSTGWSRATRRA
jgi:hypothetical protein